MNGEEIADIAERIIPMLGGDGVPDRAITDLADLALPALVRMLPAVDILVPLIRRVILPAVENTLSSREYVDLEMSLSALEGALSSMVDRAGAARARLMQASDGAIDEYLADNNLYRKDA